MMQAAGVNAVRMGEFAWSAIEPAEGRLDFGLFDRAIAILTGGKPLMATPPPGVVAHQRISDGVRPRFLLNYTDAPAAVTLPASWRDALTGQPCGDVEIPAVDLRLMMMDA